MRRIILLSVACPTVQYFCTLSHKWHYFRKKKDFEREMCFDFPHNFCRKHFSFWEELREIWSKAFIGLHVKYPLFLSDFNETWIFSTKVWKYSSIKVYGNSSSGGRDVLCGRTDRQTLGSWQSLFAILRKRVKCFFYSHYRPRYRDWLFLSFFLVFCHYQVYGFFDTTAIIFVLFLHHGQDSSLKRETDPSKSVFLWFLLFFL